MKKIVPERKLFFGMMMVVTTILAIVFVSYLQSKKVRNTAQWVSRTSEVLYNSETILATVMNNVTDARGYALTGSDKLLGSLQKSG
ncbi:MAG: CHASE3 domain-containing protein, partial [Chitinophagaceae bacterium]|nr:CHASE3 domain-containing protein [Chitinophagaceae bacterium]